MRLQKCKEGQLFSNITSVDLITADTVSPTLSFISSALRLVYDALDHILAHADDHVRHDAAEFDFDDLALKSISR